MHLPHPQPGLSPGACPYPSPPPGPASWAKAPCTEGTSREYRPGGRQRCGGSAPRSACSRSSRGLQGSTSLLKPGVAHLLSVPQVMPKAGGDAICMGAPPVLSPERGVALFSLRGDITCPVGSAPGCSGGAPEEPVIWRGWGAGEGARRDPFPGVSWLILGQTSPVKASGQGNLQPQPSQGLWESRNLEPRAEGARLGN